MAGTSIAQVNGFREVEILKFRSTQKQFGEFEAEWVVTVDKDEYDKRSAKIILIIFLK